MWFALGALGILFVVGVIGYGIKRLNDFEAKDISSPPHAVEERPHWLDPNNQNPPRNKAQSPATVQAKLLPARDGQKAMAQVRRSSYQSANVVTGRANKQETKPTITSSVSDARRQLRRELIIETANLAMKELPTLLPAEIEDRYGHIDLDLIASIAKGNTDPLAYTLNGAEARLFFELPNPTLGRAVNMGIQLLHFTSEANVPSIETHGLLPLRELRQSGLTTDHVSSQLSRQLDQNRGLDQFVHLVFSQQSTMAYVTRQRIDGRLMWYSVSPSVLMEGDVLYCRNYANKTNAELIAIDQMSSLDLMALIVGFARIGYWQALVKNTIPSDKLTPLFDAATAVRGNNYGSTSRVLY